VLRGGGGGGGGCRGAWCVERECVIGGGGDLVGGYWGVGVWKGGGGGWMWGWAPNLACQPAPRRSTLPFIM
jgi:hypothetical protein